MRLNSASHFKLVLSHAQQKQGEYLRVFFLLNHLPYPRLGVMIVKRIVKQANKRNQLKRVIREMFRLHQYQLAGLDIIMMLQQRVSSMSIINKQAIGQDVIQLWQKITSSLR